MKTNRQFCKLQKFNNAKKINLLFTFLIAFFMTVYSFGQDLNGQYGIEFELCGSTITFGAPTIIPGQAYVYPIGTLVNGSYSQSNWELVYEGAGTPTISWALKGPTTQDGTGTRVIYHKILETSTCSNIIFPSNDFSPNCWEEVKSCGGTLTNITYLPSLGDPDSDGDGFNASEDCNDNDAAVNPDATEVAYDGIDNDCDPATLDDDLDNDGFVNANDCNDNDATINPNAVEICDNIDNNCDGNTNEGLTTTYYADVDQDGFGDPSVALSTCDGAPTGYVTDNTDCFDNGIGAETAYLGATEIPGDLIDNDCDGKIDEDDDQVEMPVYCNEAQTKVLICHNGKDKCVSINAVDAHLAHGDSLGSCEQAQSRVALDANSIISQIDTWPNPTNNYFNVRVRTTGADNEVNFQVYDINGRLVQSDMIKSNLNYRFGERLSPGLYFVKIAETKLIKVIKH